MAIDNDLSALIPDPPPPRPARRESAIEQALRRFDGEHAPPGPARAPSRPDRTGWGRPQIAALASAALVVLVSVPIWWAERDRIIPPVAPTAVTTPAAAERARSPAAPPQSATAAPASATPSAATPAEPAPPPAPGAIESNLNKLPQFLPAAPPAPAASADAAATSESNLSRLPAAPPRAAPAQRATAARTEAEAEADDRIEVTGSRIERSDFESRTPIVAVADVAPLDGEWNACTLRDPRRNPTACRSSAGRAAAQLDDGLALAWQGDLDRAIRAFDRAIAAEPDLALAYLNRGLAWQARGDLGRALADLDRAVARDRTGARGYYHRSLLYRARGDSARAETDAKRAIELDPGYKAALP